MAILAALFAFGSKFVGKVLTTALGWASTLLFGRVPQSRQVLLLGLTFGSVIWMVLLVGVLVPDAGTLLLLFIPPQEVVPEEVIRLAMLVGVIVVPAILGALTVAFEPADSRTARGLIGAALRGYPLTLLLALLLVFLAGLAIWRKVWSLAKGWTDAHVPLIVKPGAYDHVAEDLDRAVTAAGMEVDATEAPSVMTRPARWLGAVAGGSSGSLVPDRLVRLSGQDLDILIYPMDLVISGKPERVARARAAMASRLTTSAAHLTASAEAQAIEDRLAALMQAPDPAADGPARFDAAAATELESIDVELATLSVPYDEWEVLYRQRLQVERDLRARTMADVAIPGARGVETSTADEDTIAGAVDIAADVVRAGITAVAAAADDEETAQALDRAAGREWRWAARLATIAVALARAVIGGPERPARADRDRRVGEPLATPLEPPASGQ
jgi:hypothetical protein